MQAVCRLWCEVNDTTGTSAFHLQGTIYAVFLVPYLLTCRNTAAWLNTRSYLYCKVIGVFCATAIDSKTICSVNAAGIDCLSMRLWHLPCQRTPIECNLVSHVSACWLTGLGLGTPSRYPARTISWNACKFTIVIIDCLCKCIFTNIQELTMFKHDANLQVCQ